jgi:hypothetical protein
MSSFAGTWVNQYGSALILESKDDGALLGTYRSSTGSTGEYHVCGFGDTSAPTTAHGVGAALSILWRSFAGGKPDPSWHWVSGFGGQLILQSDGTPNLILNHDLVATTPLAGLGDIGSYLDKLVYLPCQIQQKTKPIRKPKTVANPINGVWKCRTPGLDLALTLELVDGNSGCLEGSLKIGRKNFKAVGFADNNADALPRQGVSLSAATGNGIFMAFSGWLDKTSSRLSLLQQTSQGTAANAQYMQTSAQTLYLERA